jgi:hypothetical protein
MVVGGIITNKRGFAYNRRFNIIELAGSVCAIGGQHSGAARLKADIFDIQNYILSFSEYNKSQKLYFVKYNLYLCGKF